MKNLLLSALALCATVSVSYAQEVRIAAHRGFWDCDEAGHAENSIASLKAAQDYSLWGSEFDVHLTSDGEVVVHHDPTVEGHKINDNTYGFLSTFKLANGETIPTLDEYLNQGALCPATMLVLEIKKQSSKEIEDALVDKCVDILKRHDLFDKNKVMFISFSMNETLRVVSKAPGFTVQYLDGGKSPKELHELGINGMDYHYNEFYKHPEWVKQAHDLGMSVNVWTVNKEKDIKAMIDLGVDCITTNDPLLVRRLLGDKELKAAAPDLGEGSCECAEGDECCR